MNIRDEIIWKPPTMKDFPVTIPTLVFMGQNSWGKNHLEEKYNSYSISHLELALQVHILWLASLLAFFVFFFSTPSNLSKQLFFNKSYIDELFHPFLKCSFCERKEWIQNSCVRHDFASPDLSETFPQCWWLT